MARLCSRVYAENSLLATKKLNGIDCCPICLQPAMCHGKTIYYRALFWALSGDTGISSEAIACHMLNYPMNRLNLPPSDAGDRGRCIRLLELIPEWIERLPELTKQYRSSDEVVISSSGIEAQHNSWAEQIPLIIKEGNLNATSNTAASDTR